MSHWQQLAVRLTSKAGNWVLSESLRQLDSPLRRCNSNTKCAPERTSKSNNAMKAPQRGYNVPTNDAKTYFINSQAQLQGEVAR